VGSEIVWESVPTEREGDEIDDGLSPITSISERESLSSSSESGSVVGSIGDGDADGVVR